MTQLNETVFSLAAISKKMSKKPQKSDLYLFGRGLFHGTLNEKQLKEFETIIDKDYKAAKEVLRQANKALLNKSISK